MTIPKWIIWDLTRASAVRSQRLIAWDLARREAFVMGHVVAQVVEAQAQKSRYRIFHWQNPGVDSNGNEYQNCFLGGKGL